MPACQSRAEIMIKKIAEAIAGSYGDADWLAHVGAARAAVSAMREPSVEMLCAAMPDLHDWGYLPEEWQAMIDYVLTEPLE